MKYGLLVVFLLGIVFAPHVSASTNCSTGCDVSGATFFDSNIQYLNWNNSSNDAAIHIKNSVGNILALKSTSNVSSWGSSQLMRFYPQLDGNYTLEVFSQGTDNNYQFKLDFNSLGTPSTFNDTNCTGTGCGGSTKIYKLAVSNSPPLNFDNNVTIPFSVKGGTIISGSLRFLENSGGCSLGCNVTFIVRRLSDNNNMAYYFNTSADTWTGSPRTLDWNAIQDGNYVLEVFYEGSMARYDVNFSFTGTDGNVHRFSDYSQYIGSGLATGNTTKYFFSVANSPTRIFGDELVAPEAKGGNLVVASLRFREDSGDCLSGCNSTILVRRLSDSNVVAYASTTDASSWSGSPKVVDWWADQDDSYVLEIFFQGSWAPYDLNMSYTGSSGTPISLSETYQFVGGGLATGSTVRYFFNVNNSPGLLLHDGLDIPYLVSSGSLFKAKLKMYDGTGGCLSGCNAELLIRDTNGSTVVSTFTTDYITFNNTLLQFTPQLNHSYFVELYYEGEAAQYDLNVDFMDNTDVNRHFEDKYQYIGVVFGTGNFVQYYFEGGPSCGNGINCPNSLCKPILLSGNPLDKIDLVFIGSGFPDSNKLKLASEFVIDPLSGLFSYEPFKTYLSKFNVWMVDLNKTYQIGLTSGGWRFGSDVEKDAMDNCPSGNEFVLLSIIPRFRDYAVPDINSSNLPTGQGTHWAHVTLGCEFLGDCNYPLDYRDSNPYDSSCQGSGIDPYCNLTTSKQYSVDIQKRELQQVFVHEFGHSFGGLWDEYESATPSYYANSGGLANCEDTNVGGICPKWVSDVNACLPICGFVDWFKPYSRTLMHDHLYPRVEYMAVNQKELTKDINSYQTAKLPDYINTLAAYVLSFSYQSGTFSLMDINLVLGYPPELIDSTSNKYKAEVLSQSNQKLFDVNFIVPTNLLYEPDATWFNDGNQIFVPSQFPISSNSDVNFVMVIPYLENGAKINIVDENHTVLLSIDTSQYMSKINTIIGYGGNSINNINYEMRYSIVNQPVSIISSANYKVQLGWSVLYEN